MIPVRHAETECNVKGIIQGQSDSALTLRLHVHLRPANK
ncbi:MULTISPECIES: histidine phosphatase family protein [Klebsiella]